MSDFGTLKTELASDLERPKTQETMTGETYDDIYTRHVNAAIRHFRSRNWWFLQGPTSGTYTSTTTADDDYVEEYAGLVQLDSLRITYNGYQEPMIAISFNEMESRHDGVVSANRPYEYTRFAGRVRLYPTPDQAYTLTWKGLFDQATTALSADEDTNVWMTTGVDLIRAQARKTIARDVLQEAEIAGAAMQAVMEAEQALDNEHFRRMPVRRLRANY